MSNETANNANGETSDLVSEKIQQLLAAVGSRPIEDTTQIEATEYNWHQPHYFSEDELGQLNDFTEQIAAAVAEKFAQLCHSDFNVTIASTTQHFAGEFFEQIAASGQNDYYLGFGPPDEGRSQEPAEGGFDPVQGSALPAEGGCGFVGIPAQTAVTWVTQLLGDTESETDASRALSDLEESLLLDIASAIVASLAGLLHGYSDIHPGSAIIRGQPPFELQGIQELCKIVFIVEQAASTGDPPQRTNGGEAYILIPCSELAPAVGKAAEANIEVSSQGRSKAILEHLQQAPIFVTARLACTALTFEEIVSLRPSDVLLLDKAIDEPVDLIVEGRTLFRGQLAKSAGQHAVVITQVFCDTAEMQI
jgi:flagellar motor switch protein FliM